MTANQEIKLQEKQELDKGAETTVPARYFVPQTDIFENDDSLTLVMEMPGVDRSEVSVGLEDDRLNVEGKIDFAKYEGLEPVYAEYNVGHYKRAFTLPAQIDQSGITADLNDGVLTLVLPKEEASKPRRIEVR